MSHELVLNQSGFGSQEYFDQTFNFAKEFQHATNILAQHLSPQAVLKYLEQQLVTYLTERAVGTEALSVQPPTHYSIEMKETKPRVYATSFPEHGEQLAGYLDFTHMPQVIGDGLKQAYANLYNLEPGEGVVIFSPSFFYKQEKSTSDVINPLMVTKVNRDQNHQVTSVEAVGWFLFPNKELTQEERRLWQWAHELSDQLITDDQLTPTAMVQTPHYWTASDQASPIEEYVTWLNQVFIDHGLSPLFTKSLTQEKTLKQGIDQKVSHYLPEFFQHLINHQSTSFYRLLYTVMKGGQETWAKFNHINFETYWEDLIQGRIIIAGFHSSSTSDTFFDSLPTTFDALRNKHCKTHGQYWGNNCPKCDKKK